MSNDRLTKWVFLWEYQICQKISGRLTYSPERKIDNVYKALIEQFKVEWNQQMLQNTKLIAYITFEYDG